MNTMNLKQSGFSIIELMLGATLGLILSFAIIQIYLAQTQTYKTANSQALIQSIENAITNLVTPTIRATGFAGCGTIITAVSNLNAGGPNPIGTVNTSPTMIMGYNGGTQPISYHENSANDASASDWSPALDSSLVGSVEKNSDVLIVLGPMPGSTPLGITALSSGSTSLTLQSTPSSSLSAGQLAAISDCGKTVVFAISSASGTTVSHIAGIGPLQNASGTFPVNFQPGAVFVPLQQTAFFVAQGIGGQSSLMRATLNGTSWTIQPLVPGVEIMKVQYGIGSGGIITQYVTADAVTNWAQVYAVRIGFIIAGQTASVTATTTPLTLFNIPVTVPTDSRLRHVFEITINLRNALS